MPTHIPSVISALPGLQAANYQRHALHGDACIWVEKNCYIDVWIEILHTLRLDPMAMLPFAIAVDFEGDQWTFFKPSLDEVRELYGVSVQEMTVWRPLVEHVVEHLGAGRLISTEADSFFLPDTSGTDYRHAHVKSTIVVATIDPVARRLGYYHNAGFFELDGEDYEGVLRTAVEKDPASLPLFAELIRIDRLERLPAQQLRETSRALLAKHFAWRPQDHPMIRFRDRFVRDLPAITSKGLDVYHKWAFATTRQLGAAFELSALHLKWLAGPDADADATEAIDAFSRIAAASKSLILKTARAVNSRRPVDLTQVFDGFETDWQRGMSALGRWLDRPR